MRCTGTCGEYIKNEVCTVNDPASQLLFDITYLAGSKLIIKNGKCDFIGCDESCYLPDLSFIDEGTRVCMFNALQE
jgi:hypothetical protein